MTSQVVITIRHSDAGRSSSDAGRFGALRYAAIVRVRCGRRSTTEQWVNFDAPLSVEVDPGEVSLDASFSSGATEARVVRVGEGQSIPVDLTASSSSSDKLRWIDLSQDKDRSGRFKARLEAKDSPLRASSPFRHRKDFPEAALEEIATTNAQISLLQGAGFAKASIVADEQVDDRRLLHVLDPRSPDHLRQGKKSGLVFLCLADAAFTIKKLCALPGPFRYPECEVHAALSPSTAGALWEVDVVPTHPELAPIIGFLRQNDQRALAMLREHVPQALELLSDKVEEPIPAAIGLAILLRAGELSRIKGWSRNLWQLFPALPDAAALHAGVMLREPEASPEWDDEFYSAVMAAVECGVPMLTDALRRLSDCISVLDEMKEGDARVASAKKWAQTLLRSSDPDAVFTTLTLRSSQQSMVFGASAESAREEAQHA